MEQFFGVAIANFFILLGVKLGKIRVFTSPKVAGICHCVLCFVHIREYDEYI